MYVTLFFIFCKNSFGRHYVDDSPGVDSVVDVVVVSEHVLLLGGKRSAGVGWLLILEKKRKRIALLGKPIAVV